MRDVLLSVVAVAVLSASASAEPTSAAAPLAGETEASTGFDLVGVKPFLSRLTKFVQGFGIAEATQLADDIAKLEVDSTLNRVYSVRFNGQAVNLRVHVFMDDVDAPDLYFFSTKPLAHQIDLEIKAFAEARGW
jgi:hypothetical protein